MDPLNKFDKQVPGRGLDDLGSLPGRIRIGQDGEVRETRDRDGNSRVTETRPSPFVLRTIPMTSRESRRDGTECTEMRGRCVKVD